MDVDAVWRAIDEQRSSLAGLLDELSPREWETPSLCAGWRVRDVAAHLTLSHMGTGPAALAFLRAGGSFNRMVRDTARRRARLPYDRYGDLLRAMVGSRRKAPGISHLEPLIDVLVHGQDIAVPLGRERPMPVEPTVAALDRVWPHLYPFRPAKKFSGVQFAGTDHPWTAGRGPRVEGPVGALLLLLTGRPTALPRLSGPGLDLLQSRLAPA